MKQDILRRSFDAGCITNMYNKYQTDNLRYATMDVIVKTFKSASNINNILFVIQTILLQFQAFLKGKDDIFVKEACNRVVSGKLWVRQNAVPRLDCISHTDKSGYTS